MILLEGAKATTETIDALRTGAVALKAMQKAMYVVLLSLSYIGLLNSFVILWSTFLKTSINWHVFENMFYIYHNVI